MLHVESLKKSFPGKSRKAESVPALRSISFDIEPGHMYTLLGPSGCGKTTTLRSVAGLERPDSGRIELDKKVLFSDQERVYVPADRRGIGMVFQSYAIWPHMTVYKNVAFPLQSRPRGQRLSASQLRTKVMDVLDVVQLTGLDKRQATDLSGGQQQRLALARALVMEPPLMLLDEPLSNLDAKLRDDMRLELKRLQRERGITSLYVTHDQTEALALSNVIAVMRAGVIEQVGRPREIYARPRNMFVAQFIGSFNFVPAKVTRRVGQSEAVVTTEVGGAAGELSASVGATDTDVVLALRPEDLRLIENPGGCTDDGHWHGTVRARAYLGDNTDHLLSCGPFELRVRSNARTSIAPGTDVCVVLEEGSGWILPFEDVAESESAVTTATAHESD